MSEFIPETRARSANSRVRSMKVPNLIPLKSYQCNICWTMNAKADWCSNCGAPLQPLEELETSEEEGTPTNATPIPIEKEPSAPELDQNPVKTSISRLESELKLLQSNFATRDASNQKLIEERDQMEKELKMERKKIEGMKLLIKEFREVNTNREMEVLELRRILKRKDEEMEVLESR